jgi:hypothetical protein
MSCLWTWRPHFWLSKFIFALGEEGKGNWPFLICWPHAGTLHICSSNSCCLPSKCFRYFWAWFPYPLKLGLPQDLLWTMQCEQNWCVTLWFEELACYFVHSPSLCLGNVPHGETYFSLGPRVKTIWNRVPSWFPMNMWHYQETNRWWFKSLRLGKLMFL